MTAMPVSNALSIGAILISLGVAGYSFWSNQETPPPPPAEPEVVVEQPEAETLERADVEKIVHEYLLENPTLLIEVQQALEKKQEEERLVAQQIALTENKDKIFGSEYQVEIGDPNAPITIVEFYDYNCGFCQRALGDMQKFVAEDKDVKFILKEFPVLGEASLDAHKVSLAFSKLMPEKAEEFHNVLLSAPGRKDGEMAIELAVKLGADRDAITSEIDKPYILDAIKEVYAIADSLGITGTPSYVVGDEVVFGAVGHTALNQKVTAIRECGKATC
ncbi:MAG: DsbA family protein [Rhizobiaceae bacterium]